VTNSNNSTYGLQLVLQFLRFCSAER